MVKRMLVDAKHPEETRVVVLEGNEVADLDFEVAGKKNRIGDIYLGVVVGVASAFGALFVDFGGKRHGFLPFSETHPNYYHIPVADREELLELERKAIAEAEAALAARRAAAPVQPALPEELPELSTEEVPPPVDAAPLPETDQTPETSSTEVEATEPSLPEPPQDYYAVPPIDEAEISEAAPPEETKSVFLPMDGDEIDEAAILRRVRMNFYRRYRMPEVITRGQVLLVQVTKEERGNKGASLTTYLSLPGRYCVLMPNTPWGGGVSRKINNPEDRKRLKELMEQLEIPDGMSVIMRTAGIGKSTQEIRRDLDYLMKLWNAIREETLRSVAPKLIYEEANLIKRSIRDIYSADIDEILVEGEEGYHAAKEFMNALMPSHVRKIHLYKDPVIPLFFRYRVENQIDEIHGSNVQLKSGGYIVISPTEALVAIDVNSGRSTRERNIESTAFSTNMEAAEEIAKQLRLRDLGGLIVIDFIDMEEKRHNISVERRLKECMKVDRARIQIGRISPFGLLELSRQRLRPSLIETNFEKCTHCNGTGTVRSVESASLAVLRALEEEWLRRKYDEVTIYVPSKLAFHIFNHKREILMALEQRYNIKIYVKADENLNIPNYRLERIKTRAQESSFGPITAESVMEQVGEGTTGTTETLPQEQAGDDERGQGIYGAEAIQPEAEARRKPHRIDQEEDGYRRRGRRGGRRRREYPEKTGRAELRGTESAPVPTSIEELFEASEKNHGKGNSHPAGKEQTSTAPKQPPKKGWWNKLLGGE